jgi:hypothetical protein
MKLAFLIEPPFSYRSNDGKITGCDVALARAVLDMADIEASEFVETGFAQLLVGLTQGRWRYAGVAERESFEPEFAWQVHCLQSLAEAHART